LIDALAARFGGTAYASIHLARQLARMPDTAAVSVITRAGSIVAQGLADDRDVRCVTLPNRHRTELLRRIAWEGSRLPSLASRARADLLISMSGMLPRRPGCPTVCLLFNPVMYERDSAANRLRRWTVRHTARFATKLAAPSSAMAALVRASVGRACAVTPLGIDHDTFSPADRGGEEILCVADFYAHKRHDVILEAWERLRSPRPPLRLIGNPSVDPAAYERLRERIARSAEADRVVLEHHVSLARLIGAYRDARVFVSASEHESFCMPIVESMACGVPVLARDLPSLRETGGDGAAYVGVDDPAVWARVLQRLTDDDVAYEHARQAAIESAARFSWERFAHEVAAHVLAPPARETIAALAERG
jgi:glycosyltransferase involved in cell wall biosynthesis